MVTLFFFGGETMLMLVEFDLDADIIDVPQHVIDYRNRYRNQFYKWLSDPSVKHKYWRKVPKKDGGFYMGLCYRSDAFLEWLNRKLRKTGEQATLVEAHVSIEEYHDQLPSIFF